MPTSNTEDSTSISSNPSAPPEPNGKGARRVTRRNNTARAQSRIEPSSKPKNGDFNPKGREHAAIKPSATTPAHKFIQKMTCQSLRKNGSQPEQCQSCIERRNDSGGCRFSGYRAFKLLQGESNLPAPAPENETTPEPEDKEATKKRTSTAKNGPNKKLKVSNPHSGLPPGLDFKDYRLVGNRELHDAHEKYDSCLYSISFNPAKTPNTLSEADKYILKKISPTLSTALKRELLHEQQTSHPNLVHPVIRINEDPKERSLCDACATTLFIISYICHVCGREYCIDCYDDWDDELENIRFDMCSRNRMHKKEQMLMAVRACENEIQTLVDEIDAFIADTKKESLKGSPQQFRTRILSNELFSPVYEVSASDFDEESFKYIWGLHGRPVIIKDCLSRFQLPWDPEYFINNFGDEKCALVQSCPPFESKLANVSKFFKEFGKPHKTAALKLKDWPPNADFAEVFPDLMADFEQALPDAVSKHIRRDGVYNLASRFPNGHNKPDLGPKMYNAFPATIQTDGKIGGTTNLHRDITDAINFMMYSTSAEEDSIDTRGDRTPGAIWDIFPIGASDGIREYLDKQFPNEPTDPFHRQNCYLAQDDLEILHKEHGIQSYRIFQRPGDAILIPAGCAHQVRNIKDCIKVAVDFLSPENVEIGAYLIQENRKVSERAVGITSSKKGKEAKKMSRVKKEDVLQMWKCLMFYYTGVREQLWGDEGETVIKIHGKGEDTKF